MPNVWFVGYGLDDNGTKRAWEDLYALPKPPGFAPTADDVIFDNTSAAAAPALLAMREKLRASLGL
jgi:hypothetical protein